MYIWNVNVRVNIKVTSPTKALAATTPRAVVMWLKYAMGLSKTADLTLSTCFPSENDANAINVPCPNYSTPHI